MGTVTLLTREHLDELPEFWNVMRDFYDTFFDYITEKIKLKLQILPFKYNNILLQIEILSISICDTT